MIDETLAIYLGIGALFIVVLCIVGIIVSQRIKIKNLAMQAENLHTVESEYQNLILEKTRLEEKCAQLQETLQKYNELSEKYLILEREAAKLAVNLEQEKKNAQEKIKLLEDAEQKLSDTFKSISLDALSKNNQNFLDLAKSVFAQIHEKTKNEFSLSVKSIGSLVEPIQHSLGEVDLKLKDLEKSRVGAYEALRQQVSDLLVSQNSLKEETGKLVSALHTPNVRGRWGEMQLRRVVELAGMIEHCDFNEQVNFENEEGEKFRPDMVIYLPGEHQIVVDAKTPLSAYLQAIEEKDEQQRKFLMKQHAKQIRSRVVEVASKKYWEQFQPGPSFIVLFLPGEIFFSAALEQDPSLIEFAMQQRVVISTPTVLLALLHSIAMGWRQENLAENAKEIIKMGQELYKRLCNMTEHLSTLGKNINSAVHSYNSTITSMESRVLVTARKFRTLELHEKNLVELNSIETALQQPKKQLENGE